MNVLTQMVVKKPAVSTVEEDTATGFRRRVPGRRTTGGRRSSADGLGTIH